MSETIYDDKNFDFANAINTQNSEKEKEEATENVLDKLKGKLGSKTKEIKKLKKQIATSGSLTSKIIKEARELAESKKGLDVDKFMKKHKLTNLDIEQTLNAPLKKDGSFA